MGKEYSGRKVPVPWFGLDACPFCDNGGAVEPLETTVIEINPKIEYRAKIECGRCGATNGYSKGISPLDAMRRASELWNQRLCIDRFILEMENGLHTNYEPKIEEVRQFVKDRAWEK